MSKLYFRHGAMNSGMLQVAYNYEERGQRVLLAKPGIDTKGAGEIVPRLGMNRNVDFLIQPDDDARAVFAAHAAGDDPDALLEHVQVPPVACLLIDEAQILTPGQVDDLFRIAVLDRVPVIAYGLRTDFRTRAFPGSARLLEIAHSLEELKTICRCGRKAVFNTRRIGDTVVFDGDQVAIDGAASTNWATMSPSTYERHSDSPYFRVRPRRRGLPPTSAGAPFRPFRTGLT